ncbi:hypothetical protein SRHO_G00087800 [Serrasalmus rhombeus]
MARRVRTQRCCSPVENNVLGHVCVDVENCISLRVFRVPPSMSFFRAKLLCALKPLAPSPLECQALHSSYYEIDSVPLESPTDRWTQGPEG